ncbi:TOBE domain-containing protein [Propionibacterium sp.]|uniref:TOBE domain-containing protein n=1 Tax=Propionibacterium sp. TaxID=1977903 RepID=UPI0039E79F65
MRLSTRNQLHGEITSIKKGEAMTIVEIALDGSSVSVTAAITTDAVKSLGLNIGDPAYALIKATEVQIAVD